MVYRFTMGISIYDAFLKLWWIYCFTENVSLKRSWPNPLKTLYISAAWMYNIEEVTAQHY